MSGIFQTFNVAKLGMLAQQNAVNVASHNIANANTEGFSRQRVNLETTQPFTYAGIGQFGTGVEVESITRTRDNFLDAQIRLENAMNGRYEASGTALEQVEMIFLEPSDTGLNSALDEFWNSWQELSKTPENSNAKTMVAQNALSLTDMANHMDGQLEALESDLTDLQASRVCDANVLIGQINDMNDQICRVKLKGLEPNDLMDRRDLLADKLSAIVDIETSLDEYGSMQISNRETGKILLDANPKEAAEVEMSVVKNASYDETAGEWTLTIVYRGDITGQDKTVTVGGASGDFQKGDVIFTDSLEDWEDGAVAVTKPLLEEGELAGNSLGIEKTEEYRNHLDSLMNGIALGVNAIHEETGQAFFTISGTESEFTAGNIRVNENIMDDVNLVQAGQAAGGPAGDGSRALAIAGLRNGRFDIENMEADIAGYVSGDMYIPSNDSGTSFDNFYKDLISTIGIDSQSAIRGAENQDALLLQLNQRKDSISGVSIDEEVASLIQYQTAYQANARVMETLSLMLDTLINGLGA